jgi:hypothetical protein
VTILVAALVLRNSEALAGVYRTEWLRLANEPKVATEQIMKVDNGLTVMHELRELGI